MSNIIYLVIGLLIGAWIGIFTMALLSIAHKADKDCYNCPTLMSEGKEDCRSH